MTSVLVVGSVALDTIETPFGRRVDVLGGSATHFSVSASHFAPVRLVGVVGRDFPREHVEMLQSRRVDTSGLEFSDGRTFRWHGRFEGDMANAQTLAVELNVFESFRPRVPPEFAGTPFVLLGNCPPRTQREVLEQLRGPRFVLLDTINLWIRNERPALLELLPRVDALCVNLEEVQLLADSRTCAGAIRRLLELGARSIIVKRGEHGATLATREFQFFIPAYPTEQVLDPTGAGDSFAGGILGYLAQNDASPAALRRALVYGSVMGSFAVEEFGTERLQKVSRQEIDARVGTLLDMIKV